VSASVTPGFFKTGSRAGIQASREARLGRQLSAVDAARRPEDMNRPGWDWHPLEGDLAGHRSVSVNGNWRLTLRDDVLPARQLQVGEAAAQLGVDRTALSKVLNGRAAITPPMALRIERWLGRERGEAAEVRLAQQAACDPWRARRAAKASKALSRVKARKLQVA